MRLISLLLCLIVISCSSSETSTENLKTPFELEDNYSAAYEEGIDYFTQLDDAFTSLKMIKFGTTDIGKPLHLAILSKEYAFTPSKLALSKKPLLFINNAIHPGEPCGVDATMLLYRDILTTDSLKTLLNNVNIVAIPYYNVGGALNRNSTSRANQNGPKEYGFRGNAKNLDLNRDFIKADSKNAKSFIEMYTFLDPDVFIDNHTSNGADYSYTITLINTVMQKLPGPIKKLMEEKMVPELYTSMEKRGWPMIPYVNSMGPTPESGLAQFNDSPRYSSGYAGLHNALSFTSETHMLKPYKDRVESNYQLMLATLEFMQENANEISAARDLGKSEIIANDEYNISWSIDTTQIVQLPFKGYMAEYITSEVTGEQRLFYNRERPMDTVVNYLPAYAPTDKILKPKAYVIPQGYSSVIERLVWNRVEMKPLTKDTVLQIEQYFIDSFDSRNTAYEGHFLHSNIKVSTEKTQRKYLAGDVVVTLGQDVDRYIIETLEPQSSDSFFAWNFFDGILQQKEYFSPYVFEDQAALMLKENPSLKTEFDSLKQEGRFNNWYEQLDFLYKQSPNYERSVNKYPIGRIMQ